MWDRLSFFGWNKKKSTVQPVQREVSVTLTNGDRRETIQRSPTGTKLASSSTKQGLDDDNSSEASTSLNFGFKAGSSPRRHSSFSFSREPLDLPTWSNVTSPGFTTRLVQQASGNSPLKEFNDSLSHSPFRKSPYRDLGLGELPFVSYSRKPSPPVFPSPQRASSLRSGVSSSMYNRDRRRNARQGTTFVRIAPIDPSMKANVSISRKSSSPPHGMSSNGGPYPPRGSPRAGSEPYRPEGLGGIPQQELAMRFNRLWPSSPGGPVPGPGRPSSPTSPSNIMEALAAGRKRTRDQDTYYPPNATPPSVSPPSKISIGIGDTPVRPQVSKRVKFLGGPEGHDRPMMVGYPGMGAGDNEPLSSESILEQMNQTEKRFLPDSTSTPYSIQKKPIRMPGSDDQPSALHSALRKRRSQTSIMSAVEDDARGEKVGRFCTCNECYAEAAGISMTRLDQSFGKDGSLSPRASDEKSTNTAESRSKETCDKGVSTTEFDRGAYFREAFRKADKKKPSKDDDIDDLMPYGKTVITKEMYERDKRKRIERYYRILKMKPPGGSIFDPCPGNNSSTAVATPTTTSTSDEVRVLGTGAGPSSSSASGFNFGSPPSTSGGFSVGKQTSPVAPTITTTACSTITSPSSTGIAFGVSTLSSTAQASSTNATFGIAGSSSLNTTVTPSSGLPTFGSPSAPTQISFSGGIDSLSKPKPPTIASAESSEKISTPITKEGSTSGGFNFSGSSTATAVTTNASAPPTFGLGAPAANPLPVTTNSTSIPTFGGFGASTGAGTTLFGTGSTSTGENNTTKTSTPAVSSGSGGFSFGKPLDSAATSNNSSSGTAAGALPATFSFGGSTSGQAGNTSTPPSFAPPSSGKPSDSVDNKSLSSTTAAPATGGFNFSTGSTPAATTSASITGPTIAFGGSTSTTVTTPNTTATTTTGLGTASTNPPTFGGTAGSGSIFGKPVAAITTTSAGSFGTSFGASGTSTGPGNSGFSFGGNTASSGGGGFNFSGGSTPATTISSLATSPPSAFGGAGTTTGFNPTSSTFGSGTSTTKAETSASSNPPPAFGSTPNVFGQTTTTTASTGSFGSTFGTPGTTPAKPGFSFGGSSTPSGGFSFSGGQTPATTISSMPTSPPSAFGGAATTGFNPTSATAFGANTSTTAATGSSSNPPAFGTTGGVFGQSTAATTTASTGSFGSSFGSSGSTPANTGFSFGGNSTSGGFNFSSGATPATTVSSLAPAPAGAFGGSAAPTSFNAATPFASNTNAATTGTGVSSNPPSFGTPANVFGSSATPTTTASTASFGTAFGSASTTTPANTGFAFGSANANSPPQGTAGSAPFQFGQQAAQGVPGGFNFAASAPAPSPGGQPMFSMGSASVAPRRRDVRRRHR